MFLSKGTSILRVVQVHEHTHTQMMAITAAHTQSIKYKTHNEDSQQLVGSFQGFMSLNFSPGELISPALSQQETSCFNITTLKLRPDLDIVMSTRRLSLSVVIATRSQAKTCNHQTRERGKRYRSQDVTIQ